MNEASQTGCKTIKSQGRGDRERSYLAVVEDWIRQETVQGILTNRGAIPLQSRQFYDRWGSGKR